MKLIHCVLVVTLAASLVDALPLPQASQRTLRRRKTFTIFSNMTSVRNLLKLSKQSDLSTQLKLFSGISRKHKAAAAPRSEQSSGLIQRLGEYRPTSQGSMHPTEASAELASPTFFRYHVDLSKSVRSNYGSFSVRREKLRVARGKLEVGRDEFKVPIYEDAPWPRKLRKDLWRSRRTSKEVRTEEASSDEIVPAS